MGTLDDLSVLVDGLDHPEGVTVGPDGTVYAGGEAGQVYRIDVEGGSHTEVGTTGGFILGLCCDGHGRVYCCDISRKEVVRVDPSSGATEVYSSGTSALPMANPNWPVFDADGNLYVTDSGGWKADDGRIYRVSPQGETTLWCTETTSFPNGACLSPAGDALWVLESLSPALVSVPIREDGSAGPREVLADLTGCVPDGVAVDADGDAWIFCYRPDRVLRVRDGKAETVWDDPEGTILGGPANGLFTGPHLETLIISNLGRWHLTITRPGVKGHPLPMPEVG